MLEKSIYISSYHNHKSAMLTNKKTGELAVHFNCIEDDISEISFIVIEKITSQGDAAHIELDNYAHLIFTVLTKDALATYKSSLLSS